MARPLLLELDLTAPLADPDRSDPLDRLRSRGRRQLTPTLTALYEAADHPRVAGLVAKLGGPLSWPTAQRLRTAVTAFAASGKPTVAWAETLEGAGATASYVLATAFGQLWLQPSGSIGPLGVAVETTFWRGALDKLGVEPELEQRHEYKNAADRFTRTGFTDAHREALDAVVASVFDGAVSAIAAARELEPERVRALIDRGTLPAVEAEQAGLVDRIGFRDEVYASVRRDDHDLVFADRWPRPAADRVRRALRRVRPPRQVALVELRGGITSGRSRRGASRQAGSDTVAAALRATTADDRVGAVVLHVDSPGGSVVASETIWREVVRVREAGLPLVVAMGSVAASGGYYVACPADVIVALPATLTGSIGVLGGKFVLAELLDRAGIGTGTVQRGEQALAFSARRGFTPDEQERLAATIDAIYADFVAKVAAGRGRSVEAIEAVARGRVWTGADALDAGLVDELGDLRRAVELARERAGLPEHAPVRPAIQLPPLARLQPVRNSEDPRVALAARWSGLAELTARLGVPAGTELRMPELRLR